MMAVVVNKLICLRLIYIICIIEEKFEDTKGVIQRRKSKKDRQYNGQKKKENSTNNKLHRKLTIEQHEPH